MRSLILLVVLAVIIGRADAQPLNRETYSTMIKVAEKKMAEEDYYNALEYYEKAYEEAQDLEIAVKIANLYYFLRDYVKAERSFLRVFRRDLKDLYFEERFT